MKKKKVKKEIMTPKKIRTLNPWGHVSKIDRAFRQQLAKQIYDKLNGNHWKIWQRPVGSDEARLKIVGTWYLPNQWKAVYHGYGYATQEEAFEMLSRLTGVWYLEKVYDSEFEIEYQKNGMRYLIVNEEVQQTKETR
jgi:hypothetical protein